MTILASCTNQTLEQIEEKYRGVGYGQFKQDVANAVVNELRPIQERFYQIIDSQRTR